jgi:hypothetical protein
MLLAKAMQCCSGLSQPISMISTFAHVSLHLCCCVCAGLTRLSYDAVGKGNAVLQLPVAAHFNELNMCSRVANLCCCICAGLTRLSYDAVGEGNAVLQLPAPALLMGLGTK